MNVKVQMSTVSIAVLALGLIGNPVSAQNSDSQKRSLANSPLARLLHLGAQAKPAHSVAPGQDAVAKGLATAKTYKFASADYPGAATSIVFDQSGTTILGVTELGSTASGFTLKGANYALLNLAGASALEPTGINTSGQIVGIYADASDVVHGFLDNGGVITNIDVPSPPAQPATTEVIDINDGGRMVGSYEDASNTNHGFATNDGVNFAFFDYPGSTSTLGAGINTAGDIVGGWTDASAKNHGFLLSGGVGGQFSSLDFPLATSTTAIGINDAGEIAGYFLDASGGQHGFIYSKGTFTQVDVAGATGTELTRVKNNGHITGIYTDSSNEEHGLTGH